jgi:hypothetical protein
VPLVGDFAGDVVMWHTGRICGKIENWEESGK